MQQRGARAFSYLTNILVVLFLSIVVSAAGASPLFDEDSVLAIKLTGPLGRLIRQGDDRLELPFVLQAGDADFAVKVRVRGKSRLSVCSFPPLRINFSADDTGNSVFERQNKLKLVTHCQNKSSSQSNALQEYGAYRIFNIMSSVGYRVRLLRITYADISDDARENVLERYGFLIESSRELAARVGGKPSRLPGLALSSLDETQAATVYIFQYLIGNTDWSLVVADGDDKCCHNSDLFEIDARQYIVPYDLDLSGLVNARYAKPDPTLGISKVTKRRYRGYCLTGDALAEALRATKARREDILAVFKQMPGMSQKENRATVKYLDQFFAKADNEEKLVRSFTNQCL